MKRHDKYIGRHLRRWRAIAGAVIAIVLAICAPACRNLIFEDLDPCEKHYYVRFVFDMNMNYADAFASQVGSVCLFVFDAESGELVDVYSQSGDLLKDPDYKIDLLVEPGEYELIAWCGLENNDDHFTLPEAISHRDHAHCLMARDYDNGRARQNNWLHPLFHGRTTFLCPDEYGVFETVVPLVKDTNNVNISMQHISGQPLTSDLFTVTMTESNGHLAHDNTLISDEEIDFYPWHVTDGSVDIAGSRADDADLNFFRAEISTSRFMADRDPRINIIENATGNLLYSIPIVRWALMFRSEKHSGMAPQEYLDREDEYNIMLYLDNKDDSGWLAASIYINGWRVVNHDDTGMGH